MASSFTPPVTVTSAVRSSSAGATCRTRLPRTVHDHAWAWRGHHGEPPTRLPASRNPGCRPPRAPRAGRSDLPCPGERSTGPRPIVGSAEASVEGSLANSRPPSRPAAELGSLVVVGTSGITQRTQLWTRSAERRRTGRACCTANPSCDCGLRAAAHRRDSQDLRARHSCRPQGFTGKFEKWGGWGSNPRPANYEKHGLLLHDGR
jgi:hypothetical protein